MRKYVLWRLVWVVPSVLGIVTVGFFLTRILPGDPVQALVGEFPAPPGYVEEMRHKFGLDQPLVIQYVIFLQELARGNLGYSFAQGAPVLEIILQRSFFTLILMVPALVLASVIGVVLGLIAAPRVGSKVDVGVTVFSVLGHSVPVFWLALILMLIFAVALRALPASGVTSVGGPTEGVGLVADVARHWILPGMVLTLAYMTVVARVARASLVEALSQDFMLTAQAKGLTSGEVLRRHALPNSFPPILTVIGFNFGLVLTGAVLTETVFSWPGVGSLFVTSITNRDYPVIQGVFLLAAITVVVVNLVIDLLYGVVDPRISHVRSRR